MNGSTRHFGWPIFCTATEKRRKKSRSNAMNKLETASNAQFKRYYYTPDGPRRKLHGSREAAFRSAICSSCSDSFSSNRKIMNAKRKTSRRSARKDLLTFFIKHLVRISLKTKFVLRHARRLAHSAQLCDGGRDGDLQHRRAGPGKGSRRLLLPFAQRRFDEGTKGAFRRSAGNRQSKSRRGDVFESKTMRRFGRNAPKNASKFFTPWNSACAIPEKFDPFDDVIKPFHFDKKDPDEEHRIEVNRIHAALHPDCFARLTNASNLPSPEEKMEIPKFMTDRKSNRILTITIGTIRRALEADELAADQRHS